MLLGRAGRVPARQWRDQRRLRLHRRGEEYRTIRGRQQRRDLACRTVRVTFDPHHISYGRILQIYFSVAQIPPSSIVRGPTAARNIARRSFRSVGQAEIAKAYIAQLNQAHAYHAPLATTVEADRTFYPAEAYHQDYLTRNPNNPYIAYNDLPKIRQLQLQYPDLYRADPVLVGSGHLAAE